VAGADVTEFAGSSARRVEEIATVGPHAFLRDRDLKIPVIAVLDGFTLGGGNDSRCPPTIASPTETP